MSFATDTLTLAQKSYQDALSGKSKKLNGRQLDQHDIDVLLSQVTYWTNQVAKEASSSAGRTSGSIRIHS